MTRALALVLFATAAAAFDGPHRIVVAWETATSSCSCDKSVSDSRIGYSWAAYGLRHGTLVTHTLAGVKAALADLQAQCDAACTATP